MAAIVPWQNLPYAPALGLPAPAAPTLANQVPVTNRTAPATQLAPPLTPARAAYTWIDQQGIDWVLWELPAAVHNFIVTVDLRAVTRDLLSTYERIATDLIAHDNPYLPGASIAGQQLTHLIQSIIVSFVLPVITTIQAKELPAVGEAEDANTMTLQVQNIHERLPNPPPAFNTPGWVTTKSHLELAMESLIARWTDGWADLRPRLFVLNDRDPSGIDPEYYTVFNRQVPDPARSASPMVLSVAEIAEGRVLVGTSQAKATGYELLLRWAQAARMQRYEHEVAQDIRAVIDARNVAGSNVTQTGFLDIQVRGSDLARRVRAGRAVIDGGQPAPPNHAANEANLVAGLAAFEAGVVAYKTNAATDHFFYHPHAAVSFQANDLHRRTFCWSCWLLYRFDANETQNMVRWIEMPNYEPASVPPPGVNWRAYGNCAEAMVHNQCAGFGVHGMLAFAQNAGGHVDAATGNWVTPAPLPATPAVWV